MPPFDINDETLQTMREMGAQRLRMGDPDAAGVTREAVTITSADGYGIPCLLYLPPRSASPAPGYVHIHGGGYITGSPEGSDIGNIAVCSKLGATVLSVGYRLAPEHPIPAPLDDCYAGLAWLHENAESLGIDRSRIAIGGESAGGGLAAALAIKARDAGEYAVCHQHLTYPMLDNLTGSEAQPGDPLTGEFVWTRARNQYGWKSYLGGAAPVAPQVPSRVESYEGLPHTWMFTAGLDLFRDENIDYARNLMQAGVAVELQVFESACHGFQLLPGTRLGARYVREHMAALARGLGIELDG